MSKRALLGLFTIVALVALFGVYYVLSDFAHRRGGYRLGVRFSSAAGLNPGALVYESGVVVGSVDKISLLPDYSSEVVLAISKSVNVPMNARFLIVQPLTGDPTVRIFLTRAGGARVAPAAPFPHELLPIADQPHGEPSLSLTDFLAQGQTQIEKVDGLISEFQERGPRLMDALEQTLASANRLTTDADRSVSMLSRDADHSLNDLSQSSHLLTAQLSQSLALASANIVDMTSRLDASAKTGQPHIEHMLAQLDDTTRELAASVDSLHAIAGDPSLHANVVDAARSFAKTADTLSGILGDLRNVTGDPRAQAQLRDAVANIDAAMQKANSLLGAVGGKSNVNGVDTPLSPATLPQPGAQLTTPQPMLSPLPQGDLPVPTPAPTAKFRPAAVLRSLFGVQVRMGELSPVHRDAAGMPLTSPLLTEDRGPQTDITLVAAPHAATNYLFGANDIGQNTSLTVAGVHHTGAFSYGGGVLYSRLGVLAGIDGKSMGLETRVYDPRRGTVDVYGRIFANPAHTMSVFGGERDATRATRRDVYGLQFDF